MEDDLEPRARPQTPHSQQVYYARPEKAIRDALWIAGRGLAVPGDGDTYAVHRARQEQASDGEL